MVDENPLGPYENEPYHKVTARESAVENSDGDIKKCPFCKEWIYSDAIKCKHCGSVLVPISQPVEPQRKSADYIVTPSPNSNSMLGHGWGVLAVSIIFSAFVGDSIGDDAVGVGDDAVGMAILGALIVIPWSIWLLSKASANKILPAISLILITLTFIAAAIR